jgi:ribosomal protein S18 acetylase RimI-like enzyme
MPVRIRPATVADVPVLCEFNRRLAQETEGKILDAIVLTAGVTAVLEDPAKGVYFVAEDGRDVVGQIMVTTEWSDWRNGWLWWIQSVYVRADARRRGVLRALYDHVFRAAQAQKPPVIGLRLYVEEHNHAAQETYRRLGMEPMGFLVYHRWPL